MSGEVRITKPADPEKLAAYRKSQEYRQTKSKTNKKTHVYNFVSYVKRVIHKD